MSCYCNPGSERALQDYFLTSSINRKGGDRMARERIYKYRRCPKCKGVFPAGEFEPVDVFEEEGIPWHGDFLRECPGCGYKNTTSNFPIVNKPRPREPGEDKI
jgi:hypothetical protein